MAFYQINRIYLLVVHGKAECRTKNFVNIYFYLYEIKLKQRKNSYRVFKCIKKMKYENHAITAMYDFCC